MNIQNVNTQNSYCPYIVLVIGPTASGKSKFAQILNQGILLNADSQQVYKHLKIACNRDYNIPLSGFMEPYEMCTVKRWLQDILFFIESEKQSSSQTIHKPFELSGNDNNFVNNILSNDMFINDNSIEKNSIRKRIVIVGGTDYYLDYFVRKDFLIENDSNENLEYFIQNKTDNLDLNLLISKFKAGELNIEESYELLKRIDLLYSTRIHPNDERKIHKGIQFYIDNKIKLSSSKLQSKLRFNNIVVFRMKCNENILESRIDKRVDEMIINGLIEELIDFRKNVEPTVIEKWKLEGILDFSVHDIPSKGIFQCIGYKEMRPYINRLLDFYDCNHWSNEFFSLIRKNIEINEDISNIINLKDIPNYSEILKELKILFISCTNQLKLKTKLYAKQQNKWFQKRWSSKRSPLFSDGISRLFEVDVSHLNEESWVDIRKDVEEIVSKLEHNEEIPEELLKKYSVTPNIDHKQDWEEYFCKECNLRLVGSFQKEIHYNSKKHRKRIHNLQKKSKWKNKSPTPSINDVSNSYEEVIQDSKRRRLNEEN